MRRLKELGRKIKLLQDLIDEAIDMDVIKVHNVVICDHCKHSTRCQTWYSVRSFEGLQYFCNMNCMWECSHPESKRKFSRQPAMIAIGTYDKRREIHYSALRAL